MGIATRVLPLSIRGLAFGFAVAGALLHAAFLDARAATPVTILVQGPGSFDFDVSAWTPVSPAIRLRNELEGAGPPGVRLASWRGQIQRRGHAPLREWGSVARLESRSSEYGSWVLAAAPLLDPLPPLTLERPSFPEAVLRLEPDTYAPDDVPLRVGIRDGRKRRACPPEWQPGERFLIATGAEPVELGPIWEGQTIEVFHPRIGLIRSEPQARIELRADPGPLAGRWLKWSSPSDSSAGALVLFGETEFPIAWIDPGTDLWLEAPAGEWRIRILTPSGFEGSLRAPVETLDHGAYLLVEETKTAGIRLVPRASSGGELEVKGFQAWRAREGFWQSAAEQTGALQVSRLPANQRETLCVRSPWGEFRAVEAQTGAPGTVSAVEVSFEHAPVGAGSSKRLVIAGVLADPEGGVVAGARILAPEATAVDQIVALITGRPTRGELPRATTEDGGSFRLELPLVPGRVVLLAAARDESPGILLDLDLSAEARWDTELLDLGVLTLPAPRSIAGRVVDERGRPVPGARVEVVVGTGEALRGFQPPRVVEAADEAGGFHFDRVPSGVDLVVFAEADRHLPAHLSVGADEPSENLELELEQAAELRGRVLSVDGDPIEGAQVVGRAVAAAEGQPLVPGGVPRNPMLPTRTDRTGAFTLPSVPCELWRLDTKAEGYEAATVEIAPPCGGTLPEFEIRLLPARTWAGRLLRRHGEPVAGAALLLDGVASAISGPDGGFEVEVPAADEHRLRITLPGGESMELVIQLERELHLVRDLVLP